MKSTEQHLNTAKQICEMFLKNDFAAYFVGGVVREMLLKKSSESWDIDIATSATPEQIKKVLAKKFGKKLYVVGQKFGTIGIPTSNGSIEVTSFRKESDYKDFRRPSKVKFVTSVEQDSLRRDLTINAIYYHPKTKQLLDFHGGIKDLKSKTIRFVGSAEKRIQEDPLRLLRAVRFATKLNFAIAKKDLQAIKKYSAWIKKVSAQRIKQELDKIFSDDNYLYGLTLLDQTNLFKVLFRDVDNLKKVKQSKDFHSEGNAFKHTMLAMSYANDFDLCLRYAVFFHDIGKVSTAKKELRLVSPDGKKIQHISFHRHAQKGVELFERIAKELLFSAKDKQKISYLIKHHMDLLYPEEVSVKTLIKWAQNEYVLDLIKLRIADSQGSLAVNAEGDIVKKEIKSLQNLYAKMQAIISAWQVNLLTGDDVKKILKIKAGVQVGLVLQKVKEQQISGKIKTKAQAKKYLQSLAKKKFAYKTNL